MFSPTETTQQTPNTNSTEIASIFAGKMCRDSETGKVSADTRKGVLTFSKGDLSKSALNFPYFLLKWSERESDAAEESFIVFPRIHEVKAVQSGGSSDAQRRSSVYALYKRQPVASLGVESPSPKPQFIFWLQEAHESFLSKLDTIQQHLQVSEPPYETLSEEKINELVALFDAADYSTTTKEGNSVKIANIRAFLESDAVSTLLHANAEKYCKAIQSTIPESLRRDLSDPTLTADDFQLILKSYIQHQMFREGQGILQSCVDSGLNAAYITQVLGLPQSAAEGQAGTEYALQPSIEAMLKMFIDNAEKRDSGDTHDCDTNMEGA